MLQEEAEVMLQKKRKLCSREKRKLCSRKKRKLCSSNRLEHKMSGGARARYTRARYTRFVVAPNHDSGPSIGWC